MKVSGAKNCLGFIKARTGAYIIAILGIIYGIFSLIYILFCFDDNMITKEIEKALRRVDKDISNIHEVYIIYCYIATTVLSTINSCFLLLGLVKNSPILLTTWLIIAGIGNWVSTVWIVNNVLGNMYICTFLGNIYILIVLGKMIKRYIYISQDAIDILHVCVHIYQNNSQIGL